MVYDNQPRNSDIVRQMIAAAKEGYRMCVWPEAVTEKDINAMILKRVPPGEFVRTEAVMKAADTILDVIEENCYTGLKALLQIDKWKRCNVH